LPEELVNGVKDIVGGIVKDYEKIWPKKGDKYWFITAYGNIVWDQYYNALEDEELKEIGNFFKTEEEAEETLEYFKVLHELKELADDDKTWDGENGHWGLDYDTFEDKIDISERLYDISGGAYYFKSKESAQAAVEKIGEERLKKYYFFIEETD
jgi:hypothetical protein